MKFGLPPWLRRTSAAAEYEPQAEAAAPELIQPTEDEARNGWDAESLTAYLPERSAAQSDRLLAIFNRRPSRPRWANSRYSPFRWRARA